MAKKKTNSKSIFTNGIAMLTSLLVMIFYCGAHLTASALGSSASEAGFSTMSDLFKVDNDASATIAGIMILVMFILAALVFVLSLVNMLSALNVIKNVKFLKAINMILSVVLVVAGLVGIICLAVYIKDISVMSVGWAFITNVILSAVTCLALVLDYVMARK